MKGRARSVQEKKEIIQRLLSAWVSLPDLRLGQLIDISEPADKDLFYIEDDELISLIEKRVRGE